MEARPLATKTDRRTAETDPATTRTEAPVLRLRRERPATPGRGAIRPMHYRWYPALKAAADRLAALVLLIVAAPVILLAALLVKLTSRGPAFYTQTRVGKNGRPFTIYKLRTMIHKCESLTGP